MSVYPTKLNSWQDVCRTVEKIGFLPLQECGLLGFSVEGMTESWRWEVNGKDNPWYWRYHIVKSRRVVYGKFFKKHIGFIARDWFADYANIRRDALLSLGAQKILKLFSDDVSLSSFDIKMLSGIGRSRELDQLLCELMMTGHLIISDFDKKASNWPMAVYQLPEAYLGCKVHTDLMPEESLRKLTDQCAGYVPSVKAKKIRAIMANRRDGLEAVKDE